MRGDMKLEHLSLGQDTIRDLPDETVHIWKVELDESAAQLAELKQSLSPEECARAERFHFGGDHNRFIAARGSLRVVLGGYLNLPPRQVQISYTPDKKPVLTSNSYGALQFNVTHSDALALIAVTRAREIGIDIECLRTDFDADALAKRFFAPTEYAAIDQTPPDERHATFLHYWTCKEAYLKALGTGLRVSLRDFTVALDNASVTLTGPKGNGTDIAPYRLYLLNPSPEYVGAIAIAQPG